MEKTGYTIIENGTRGFLTKRSIDKLSEYQGGVRLLETDGRDVYAAASKRQKQQSGDIAGIVRDRMQSTHNEMLEPIDGATTYRISNDASDAMIELSEVRPEDPIPWLSYVTSI